MSDLGKLVKGYTDTIDRLEPDLHMIDPGAFHASAAISLKRIADAMTKPRVETMTIYWNGQQQTLFPSLEHHSRNVYKSADGLFEVILNMETGK